MAGDPTKAAQWGNADVYIAPVGTTEPDDIETAWGVDWDAVGLLDGEEGFTWEREEDVSEQYAWGGLLVRTTRSKHKRTVKFVCLEDNDVTFDLVNPGSSRATEAGLTTAVVKVPVSKDFAIGFELRDGDKVMRRMVKRATVSGVDEIKESETDPTVYSLTVTLYPQSNGDLFTELSGTLA